ncbi:hypothetical protein EYF80_050421 [Liparis tanakae]|uniref:Uncharacterized protein n=1 Tax=Liparis tanakae TaxID=230148 RepID=A0A4Z2FEP4_9TELE|nr:hypothetical protein EYF80_050421 [Liparis tanakae]
MTLQRSSSSENILFTTKLIMHISQPLMHPPLIYGNAFCRIPPRVPQVRRGNRATKLPKVRLAPRRRTWQDAAGRVT